MDDMTVDPTPNLKLVSIVPMFHTGFKEKGLEPILINPEDIQQAVCTDNKGHYGEILARLIECGRDVSTEPVHHDKAVTHR